MPKVYWQTLDAGDNDPYSFLRYLIASLCQTDPRFEDALTSVLSSFPQPPFQVVLGLLINELLDTGEPLVLVLDDYQFISNAVIQEGMVYFIDRLPHNVHVVMAARSDPPLALARLRAQRNLLEIRANELEFTSAETTQLINENLALGISANDVALLLERTEGWVAGLQMVGFAMKNQPDSAAFVREFSGSNRYILD